jgi:5-methylcytosine-specific restriction endonuclease McrA
MAILKTCIECGRPIPATHMTCERHGSQTRQSRKMAKIQQQGTKSGHWIKLRKLALERDGYRCRLRGRRCTGTATTVHLDPRLGGNHRIATLADCTSLCRRCHGAIDAPRAHPLPLMGTPSKTGICQGRPGRGETPPPSVTRRPVPGGGLVVVAEQSRLSSHPVFREKQ